MWAMQVDSNIRKDMLERHTVCAEGSLQKSLGTSTSNKRKRSEQVSEDGGVDEASRATPQDYAEVCGCLVVCV